jgi:2-iminobutanoate/2-iminopropanoate deaminase
MKKTTSTNQAPAAIGPYSQAVRIDNLVYTSGQLGLDPVTGNFVNGGIKEQTRKVLENIQAVLEAAGTEMSKVVKTTVFLKDMNDFAEMNKVYETFFPSAPPARSAVEVGRLPKDALVEIEAIASID